MSKITDLDVLELRKFFEEALSRARSTDKKQKMRLRRKIRDEVFLLLTFEKPTPKAIMSRWEERLQDAFKVMPFGFKDELFRMLIDIMQMKHTLGKQKKPELFKNLRPSASHRRPIELVRYFNSHALNCANSMP